MKFKCSVTINLPRKRVVELFNNPENLKEWQDGFYSFQPLEGEPEAIGSKSKLVYLMGKKKQRMELIETILENDLPDRFKGQYYHEHVTNTMLNTFTDLGDKTRYDAEVHYTEFRGFIIRIMVKIIPGMFKKQVQKWMDQFKDFCERQPA